MSRGRYSCEIEALKCMFQENENQVAPGKMIYVLTIYKDNLEYYVEEFEDTDLYIKDYYNSFVTSDIREEKLKKLGI